MTSLKPLSSSWNDRLVCTVTEAAQLLGISRAFAYELAVRGEIPVIRFGRRIVVPKAQLLALLNLPMTEDEV
jgi:excisionase family DNA binding protein